MSTDCLLWEYHITLMIKPALSNFMTKKSEMKIKKPLQTLMNKESIALNIKLLKKDIFCLNLLLNSSFSKAKDKFSKYLVNSSGKDNKEKLSVKSWPIFA